VPLNLVLVPRLGILGSAVATTASYAVSWVAVLCGMRGSDLAPGPNWRLVAGLAAASGLCTLSVFVPVDGAWLVSRWVLAAWALAVMTWQTGVLRWIGQRSGVTAKEPFAGR
jgi:O-antigen/teichoic acid export membrane protein